MRIGLVAMQADPLGADAGNEHRYVGDLAAALARMGNEVRVYGGRQSGEAAGAEAARPEAGGTKATRPEATGAEAARPEAGGTKAGQTGTREWTADEPATTTPDGVVVEYGPAGEPARFGAWLRERWHEGWRPEVVHTHFWLSGLAVLPVAVERGVPVVHTYHSLGSVRRRWYGRAEPASRERVRAEKALGTSVDRIIAQCHTEVAELARLGVPRTGITVVPSGVDIEVFTPRGDSAPADPARPRVFSVGPPSPDSGFEEMVKALRWVPDAELVIAGGPAPDCVEADPSVGRLRQLAGELGLTDRIRFLGAVPTKHLPRWYRSAEVYASTSADETFGLPAVEAMACGAPVVAYGVGGVLESVVHRVTGVLVQPHDVRGFALALRGLLRNDLDRLAYADAGVDRVQSRYDWRRVVTDVVRVYDEVRR